MDKYIVNTNKTTFCKLAYTFVSAVTTYFYKISKHVL